MLLGGPGGWSRDKEESYFLYCPAAWRTRVNDVSGGGWTVNRGEVYHVINTEARTGDHRPFILLFVLSIAPF